MRPPSIILAGAVAALLASGCAAGGTVAPSAPAAGASPTAVASAGTPTPAGPSPIAAASSDPWADDLAKADTMVRASHPNPFANTKEAAWVAKLAELRGTLPTATPDQRVVQLASLLDTHSWLKDDTFHAYGVLLYPFSDGWYVVRAKDPELVGSRLVSIGGHPIADVEAAMRPLVPADNESGKLDALQEPMSTVEYLHGLGIVDDPAKPAYVFARPDGTEVTADLASSPVASWFDDLGIIGGLVGTAPEAVARRSTPIWTRLDKPTKTFVISYSDFVQGGLAPALTAMTAALDDGAAERVLLDMRYIRGGNGSLAAPLVEALKGDPRINRPGGLIVMIGRENVSAGTLTASILDAETKATFVGEMTPARADNFLCRCVDIDLANSGLSIEIPTEQHVTGDPRLAIEPDVPVALSAADFFAGRDPALQAALALKDVPAP